MSRVRLILWWAVYHSLNLMYAAEPSNSGRRHLHIAMQRHDLKHPTGEAPKW